VTPDDKVMKALVKSASPAAASCLRLLKELREDPIAQEAFPDHDRFLWIDFHEFFPSLGSVRDPRVKGGWRHTGLEDLAARRIIEYKFAPLSGRASVGFRFLEPPYDLSRDVAWQPLPGDVVHTSLAKMKVREVVAVSDFSVTWRWKDNLYNCKNSMRTFEAIFIDWVRWVRRAKLVEKADTDGGG
jgi:hypothetical protein